MFAVITILFSLIKTNVKKKKKKVRERKKIETIDNVCNAKSCDTMDKTGIYTLHISEMSVRCSVRL